MTSPEPKLSYEERLDALYEEHSRRWTEAKNDVAEQYEAGYLTALAHVYGILGYELPV